MRKSTRAFATAAITALALAGCAGAPEDEATQPSAAPVSYPVPDGCPTAEQFGEANVGDPAWAESLDAALLNGEVATPLPANGCGYAVGEVDSAEGVSYRKVIVVYFNLDKPGKLTQSDLATWGKEAGGTPAVVTDLDGNPTGELSTSSLSLPADFTGWEPASVGWVDGETAFYFDETDKVIPAHTRGASGRIEFILGADRVDAVLTATATGGPVSDPMSGIIAISGSSTTITLSAVNPSTGSIAGTRSFSFPTDVVPSLNRTNAYFAQQSFTPSLDRVAATKYITTDGSRHVGWVTKNGVFVDVSEAAVGAGSDFSEATSHTAPKFGADGSFYYLDGSASAVMRLGAEATTPETIGVGAAAVVMTDVDTSDFFVWPSGTILPCGGCIPRVEYETPGPFGMGATVSDWLDEETFVCSSPGDSEITLGTPFPTGDSGDIWGCGMDGGEFELLPSSDRSSWNPVGSPDGQAVAFISSPAAGESAPELFTIGRNGGDPVKVATSQSFARTVDGWGGSSNRLQLLDWR